MQSAWKAQPSAQPAKCRCSEEIRRYLTKQCVQHKSCPNLHCDLCSIDSTVENIMKHFESFKHTGRRDKLYSDMYLTQLPPPTAAHYRRLSSCICSSVKREELTNNDIHSRKQSLIRFNSILQKIDPTCTIRVYGSTINGFGLKHSNLNIELVKNGEEITESSTQFLQKIFACIAEIREHDFEYCDFVEELDSKIPRLSFVELTKNRSNSRRLRFELSVAAEKSWKSSNLLRFYSEFDERAHLLGLALRLWARSFKLDNQENCVWPSIAFPILVIHFLQRTDPPVLPCFHELLQGVKSKSPEEKKDNNEEVTQEIQEITEVEVAFVKQKWQVRNQKSVGELLINLFHYYIFEFQCGTNVVSIRKTTKTDTHANKGWGTKILAIEDPTRPTCNLSRSVGNQNIYNFFMDVWRDTYKYLVTPRTINGPLFTEKDFILNAKPISKVKKLSRQLEKIQMSASNDIQKEVQTSANDHESSDEESNTQGNSTAYTFADSKRLIEEYGFCMTMNPEIGRRIRTLREEHYFYSLEFESLEFHRLPPRTCRLCRKPGHTQSHCLLSRKVDLVEIPEPMPTEHKLRLNHIIDELFDASILKHSDENRHNAVLLSLARFVRESTLFANANLELFGSTKNGFGAWDCDLDICLTFKNNTTGEGIDQAEIITKLFELLSKHPTVLNPLPITQAKVPILKFDFVLKYQGECQKYECDISLYNRLALYNTKLLRTYCEIDERVRKLGFIVKHFAKTCEIGDASRGSLSSYAYTLMTLHYLQQCSPPVIPVLQELYDGNKPERMIDSWNTWFYEDFQNIPNIWRPYKSNTLSVAELFIGFLRYYSETFNFKEQVVCINSLKPLSKSEKNWNGKRISIEDPFLLTHNLGQGVDDHMAVFIKIAICKGRNVIGRPPDELPHNCKSWNLYFFDKEKLTVGNLPTGRGCRKCGKIGHKMSECPIRLEQRQQRKKQNSNHGQYNRSEEPQRNHRSYGVEQEQRQTHNYRQNHYENTQQRQWNENHNHQHSMDGPRYNQRPQNFQTTPGHLRKPKKPNQNFS